MKIQFLKSTNLSGNALGRTSPASAGTENMKTKREAYQGLIKAAKASGATIIEPVIPNSGSEKSIEIPEGLEAIGIKAYYAELNEKGNSVSRTMKTINQQPAVEQHVPATANGCEVAPETGTETTTPPQVAEAPHLEGDIISAYQGAAIMKAEAYFICDVRDLKGELKQFKGLINKSNTLPILDTVLVEILEGDKVQLTASDLETTVITTMRCKTKGAGKLCVNFAKLYDYMSAVKSGNVLIKLEAERAEIHRDNSVYVITDVEDSAEFPKVDDKMEEGAQPGMYINHRLFCEALKNTLPFTGSEDGRPVMEGVYMEIKANEIEFAATDAHKLCTFLLRRNETNFSLPENYEGAKVIIPAKAVKQICATNADGVIHIKLTGHSEDTGAPTNATFTLGNVRIISRLIEGKYPNYGNVIPSNGDKFVKVNRTELLQIIGRVGKAANKATNAITISLNGKFEVSAKDFETGAAMSETVSAHKHTGGDIQIAFNAKFLKECLGAIGSENVLFCMNESNRPALILPNEAKADTEQLVLIMPVMITDSVTRTGEQPETEEETEKANAEAEAEAENI